MDLPGKVAVITGAASGIGRGTALAMARRGTNLVLADINDRRLIEVQAEATALGVEALTDHCDVSRLDDVTALSERTWNRFGRADILMNNAGVVARGALELLEPADWEWCLGINVMGVVHGIRAFLPSMIERGSGYIINTGSVAGLLALTGEGAPYIASKFAVNGLTEALALYARPRGIGISLLCPGSVDTNLAETGRSVGMTPEREVQETAQAATVQGNVLMTPEQVGEIVCDGIELDRFFIMPEASLYETLRRRTEDWNAFMEARLAAIAQV